MRRASRHWRPEITGGRFVETVEVAHALGFVGKVEQIGHRGLHSVSELIGLDDAVDALVAWLFFAQVAIHRLDEVDLLALQSDTKAFVMTKVAYAGVFYVGR